MMIGEFEEDFLDSLPTDFDEALGILFKRLSTDLNNQIECAANDQFSTFDLHKAQRRFMTTIVAFIDAHEIDLEIDRSVPSKADQDREYFEKITSQLHYYIKKREFERSIRLRSGKAGVYVLSPALKLEINHYIVQVRELIAHAEMTDLKRTALTSKLNYFASEVDRDRTRIEALAAAIIWTKKEAVNGLQSIEPIIEKLDRMFQSMTKATEWTSLPAPEEKKQILAPHKRIEHLAKSEDENPF